MFMLAWYEVDIFRSNRDFQISISRQVRIRFRFIRTPTSLPLFSPRVSMDGSFHNLFEFMSP